MGISTETPPPLSKRDKVQRDDAAWRLAVQEFLQLKREAEATAQRLDAAKETLIGLATHPSEAGFGVSVTRFWRAGGTDYKRLIEAKGIDPAPFRLPARQEARLSAVTKA